MIDAGIIHHPVNERVKVGFSMRNFGKQITYYSDTEYKEKLPLTFTAGFSYQIREDILTVLDISKATGQNFVPGKIWCGLRSRSCPATENGLQNQCRRLAHRWCWENASGISAGLGWAWKKLQFGLRDILLWRFGLRQSSIIKTQFLKYI